MATSLSLSVQSDFIVACRSKSTAIIKSEVLNLLKVMDRKTMNLIQMYENDQ